MPRPVRPRLTAIERRLARRPPGRRTVVILPRDDPAAAPIENLPDGRGVVLRPASGHADDPSGGLTPEQWSQIGPTDLIIVLCYRDR